MMRPRRRPQQPGPSHLVSCVIVRMAVPGIRVSAGVAVRREGSAAATPPATSPATPSTGLSSPAAPSTVLLAHSELPAVQLGSSESSHRGYCSLLAVERQHRTSFRLAVLALQKLDAREATILEMLFQLVLRRPEADV